MRSFVKLENVSPVGSFKGRGADYLVGGLERRDERLVTATAGNWGIGLAYAGRRHGFGVDVFANSSASAGKFDANARVRGERHRRQRRPRRRPTTRARSRRTRRDTDWSTTASRRRSPRTRHDRYRASTRRDARHRRRPGRRRRADQRRCTLAQGALAGYSHRGGVCASGAPAMKLSLDAGRPIRSDPTTTIAGGLAISAPIAASFERVRALVDEDRARRRRRHTRRDGTDRRHNQRPRRAFGSRRRRRRPESHSRGRADRSRPDRRLAAAGLGKDSHLTTSLIALTPRHAEK